MMNIESTYKFSIVSAIYNTAEYLEEMLDSVLRQDIGFEENIQLILVDDESTDNSSEICKNYVEKYPFNITYIKVNHKGVSHARNEGTKIAKGEIINYLDSDDKLEVDALRKVWNFYQEYKKQIDVIAIPIFFFDKEEGAHLLNKKFNRDRIVDIEKEKESIVLLSSSCFMKREVLKDYTFDERLKYGEDAKLVTQIILVKGAYGVLSTTKYHYRRRQSNNSAIQVGTTKKEWYLDCIKYFSLDILNWQVDYKFGGYIKYLIMYDLQWRINSLKNVSKILDSTELSEYINLLIKTLKYIDVRCILRQRNMALKGKIVALILKYNILGVKLIVKVLENINGRLEG